MVLPVALLLVLGSYDLSRAMQARTALKAGTEAALRCIFPTDPECRSTAGSAPIPLYNLYRDPSEVPKWLIPLYVYSGDASWIGLPTTLLQKPVTTVLDRASYAIPPIGYSIVKSSPAHGVRARYRLMTAKVPYVSTGMNRAQATSSPRFVYQNDRNSNYGPAIVVPIDRTLLRVTPQKSRDRVVIKLPTLKPQDATPCFKSKSLNAKNTAHHANFLSRCSKRNVPAIIHITGQPTLRSHADGRLSLKLRFGSERETLDLGGRLFTTDPNSGSFVPRGVPAGHFSNDHGYEEFKKYSKILLPLDKPVRII